MDKKLAERLMTANTQMGRQFRDYIMEGITEEKAMEILGNVAAITEIQDNYDEDYDIPISEGIEKRREHLKRARERMKKVRENLKREERQEWIEENQIRWLEIGQGLERQREEMGITLTELSNILGTSRTRIRKFEKGEPVMMAKHLRITYQMALDHIRQTERVDVLVELTNKLLKKYQEKAFIN